MKNEVITPILNTHKCLNIGCDKLIPHGTFCCSQECGYSHYIRKTLNELNTAADKDKKRSFEFTVEEAKQLIDGYKQGLSPAKLSLATDIYVAKVCRFLYHPLVKTNFKLRRRRRQHKAFKCAELEELRKDFESNMSIIEIAAKHDASQSCIYRLRANYLEHERERERLEATIYRSIKQDEQTSVEQASLEHMNVGTNCGFLCRLKNLFRSANVKRKSEL